MILTNRAHHRWREGEAAQYPTVLAWYLDEVGTATYSTASSLNSSRTKAHPAKAGAAKLRVLASSATPEFGRHEEPTTAGLPKRKLGASIYSPTIHRLEGTMKTRGMLIVGAAIAVAACSDNTGVPTQPETPAEPLLIRQGEAPLQMARKDGIPGEYVVVLRDSDDPAAVSTAHAITPQFTYSHTIHGFAAKLTSAQLKRLRKDVRVKYIAQNGVVRATQGTPDGKIGPAAAPAPPKGATVQPTPAGLWGLDRSDQQGTTNGSYVYVNTGKGVKVYILDTGGNFTHNDFDGAALNRLKSAIDFIDGGPATDCNGHGTHVAGTIGGTTYGIAKAVTMYAVRVLDCFGNGTSAGVIAGIDWITYNHQNPAVANASLGGGFSQPVNDAMTKSILYGVTWVVASGNSNADACGFSPASTPLALTVNASDINDNRAAFSNFGPCTDIYAPGVNVLSAWIGSDNATNTISGTSMASPHVAGLAALFLQTKPAATPTELGDVLKLNAQRDEIGGNPAGTPNLLAHKQTGNCATAGAYCLGIDGNDQFPAFSSPSPGQWYYFSGPGLQRGYLRGTVGTDFDLEFYEWNGTAWVLRKNANTSTTNPIILFNSTCAFGPSNCYKMYKVKSKTGVGALDFWFDRQ
jgi:subtilisin family serine protease